MSLMWKPIWVGKFYLDKLESVWLQESEYSFQNGQINGGFYYLP